jgi:hypothetical protein
MCMSLSKVRDYMTNETNIPQKFVREYDVVAKVLDIKKDDLKVGEPEDSRKWHIRISDTSLV